MSGWRQSVSSVGLGGCLLLSSTGIVPIPLVKLGEASTVPTVELLLTNLPDGTYQFCTEPNPQDWQDGAGVCLNFEKHGTTVDGYYGYPHSSHFVCLRGQVLEDWLYGQGMVMSWSGQPWPDIPQAEFNWDQEG